MVRLKSTQKLAYFLNLLFSFYRMCIICRIMDERIFHRLTLYYSYSVTRYSYHVVIKLVFEI